MSTRISRRWYAVIGAVVLLAVLSAGCAQAPPGPPPTTTQATPATTAPPTTPAATTAVPTTTVPPTTTVTTPPTTAMTTPPVTTTTSPPTTVAVTIQGFAFSPASVTIPRGTTVTWTNRDSAPHTVASDVSGKFSSTTLGTGQSFSFTFTDAGSFPYHCGIHPSMHGTVTVT